jgi:hypothetical protein
LRSPSRSSPARDSWPADGKAYELTRAMLKAEG